MGFFKQAVLNSSMEMSQFPTDMIGDPGYVRIDSSSIRVLWFDFVEEIERGILQKVFYEFSSKTKFEGDLAEKVIVKNSGYIFSFHIRQYERDFAHAFKIIEPEDLSDIPEEEKLGRVVYLTISIKEE